MFAGEEVWLKTFQDQTCRLYGCENPGQEMIFLFGKTVPARALFCKRHAQQISDTELLVMGVAGKPKAV